MEYKDIINSRMVASETTLIMVQNCKEKNLRAELTAYRISLNPNHKVRFHVEVIIQITLFYQLDFV